MFPARFHVRRRRNTVSGTVCATTSTTTLLLLCIVFHAFTCATAGSPGKPAFTHIQHTDNDWQLLLNIEPPSDDATTAADFYYNVTVQRKIPIPKWTLDLSATGGKKEFNSSSSPLFITNNSNFEILNEAGFRLRVITAPNTLVDGDEAWSTGTLGHSFLPLQFGKGSGGLDVRGSANAIELKVRNDPFLSVQSGCTDKVSYTDMFCECCEHPCAVDSHMGPKHCADGQYGCGSHSFRSPECLSDVEKVWNYSSSYSYTPPQWVQTHANKLVSVVVGTCENPVQTSGTSENTCTGDSIGALLYIVETGTSENFSVEVKSVKEANMNGWKAGQGHAVTFSSGDAAAIIKGANNCGNDQMQENNATVYECVGGYLKLHQKTTFVLDSLQLFPQGTRRMKMKVGQQSGGKLMEEPIDTCPEGGKDRCWCKITCPKGMQHVGTDGSTCMGSGLPRCDLGHCDGPGSQNLDARALDGKMIKCEELEAMMINLGNHEIDTVTGDVYAPFSTGIGAQFNGVHGWKFEGTLHEISIESLPVHYDQLGYNTDYKTGPAHVALTSTPSVQGSPVELFVAGTFVVDDDLCVRHVYLLTRYPLSFDVKLATTTVAVPTHHRVCRAIPFVRRHKPKYFALLLYALKH
jgi:hypothetical protein